MENNITIWTDQTQLAEIKNIYAKNLSDSEFQTFLGIGKATNLNPFLREIWAVKYGTNPASIFVGRDGYRKAAQANGKYDYHQTDAVYSNDTFGIKSGEIEHTYKLSNRGVLMGAYSIVRRKGATKPIYVYVELKEYSTGTSLWKTKPATMIKKVAEAQALRMAFQDMFAGTYDESEQWETKEKPVVAEVKAEEKNEAPKHPAHLKNSLLKRIAEAKTVDELKALKPEIVSGGMSNHARQEVLIALRDKYYLFSPKPEEREEQPELETMAQEVFGPGTVVVDSTGEVVEN